MAATAYTAASAVLTPRVPVTTVRTPRCCSALPYLPPPRLSTSSFSSNSIKQVSESRRFSSVQIRASSSEETSLDPNELFTDLKEKWDGVENKSTVLLYGGGAIVAVWLSSIVVGAVNSIPLLPKILELIGLGYTGWFVYRYLLFKQSRKELATDIDAIKKKIAGTE
ncbi:hypothetical protein LWI28_010457 [Acer negundo]|uniref:Cyanobacterial aminoacyl-tRNA synthetase CAAD domain-containing protein n=1 Tax=Acer negundo TaxID=4023 RepID=A0AAD5IYK3_ACENE|nr:hypothetical protein LWI28_010457 [Acer negundo]KAK4848457.1 hypothetical protein QYF36_013286 [Acer negundo]